MRRACLELTAEERAQWEADDLLASGTSSKLTSIEAFSSCTALVALALHGNLPLVHALNDSGFVKVGIV